MEALSGEEVRVAISDQRLGDEPREIVSQRIEMRMEGRQGPSTARPTFALRNQRRKPGRFGRNGQKGGRTKRG